MQNTDIHNNDDTIVLKSGRDADGRAEAGSIAWARNWTMENVTVRTPGGVGVAITNSVAVDAPRVVRP